MSKKSVFDKALESQTFCIYPFSHLATKTEGTFKLCCRSEPLASVDEVSAVELWNGPDYKRIRQQLLNNEKPVECQDCWNLESMGTRSMRQRALAEFPGSRWSEYSPRLNEVSEDGTVPYLPRSIELKLSSLCNLRCRMCHAVDSSSWVKEWPLVSDLMQKYNSWAYDSAERQNVLKKPIISGFENNEQWWNDFEKMVDSIDLIEFAGGEPLMDPLHYRILELLERRAGEIRLKYSSNLTTLTFKKKHVFDYWKKFKSVSVYASVDGIYDVYDYIRTGSQFQVVEENLDQILQSTEVRFDEIAVACTIQIYNVCQLPEIMDYFCKKGVRFHSHRVTAPTFLNTQVLPVELKEQSRSKLLRYQEKIHQEKRFEPRVLANLDRHIKDHLNHMMGRDWSHLQPALRDYTQRLDRSRGTDVARAVPELKSLFSGELASLSQPVHPQ